MLDNEKEGLGLPPISSIVIILIAISAIAFNMPHLKSSRPSDYEAAISISALENSEDVRARLWQDPFEVVYKHKHDKNNTHVEVHSHNSLATQITKEIKPQISKGNEKNKSVPLNILGVMVGGGPYFENVENRRRRRYAVLSALEVSGYSPRDAQHIGYFETMSNSFYNKANILDLPERIPYEWFNFDGSGYNNESNKTSTHSEKKTFAAKPPTLLIWLDEDVFGSKPLAMINELLNKLNLTYSCYGEELRNAKFTVLGPSSSTTLRSMAKELEENDNSKWNNLNKIKIQILSPIAIADDELILKDLSIKEESIKGLFEDNISEGCFLRTIKSDFSLAECMKGELKLRGVKPGDDHIVLISEWDTFYGRAIPDAFFNAFTGGYSKPDYFHVYSYLKGIDGHTPEKSTKDIILNRQENNNISRKKWNSKNNLSNNAPVGNSQFDYLQRLKGKIYYLNKMLKKGKKERIKAIGVLGSDDYDKLLILQALREGFPNVLFFTTDLDARLTHSDEIKWTRNLVVASNFDLQLDPALQKNIPPFRDNYQTSVFFSTLLALNSNSNKLKKIKQSDIYKLITIQMYEIGRHGPYKLRGKKDKNTKIEGIKPREVLKDLLSGSILDTNEIPNNVQLVPLDYKISDPTNAFIVFISIFPIIVLLIILFPKVTRMDYLRILIVSFVLSGIFLFIFHVYSVDDIEDFINNTLLLEPFSFKEGISIWPTLLIMVVAIFCALYLLLRSWIVLNKNKDELSERYFKEGMLGTNDNGKDSSNNKSIRCILMKKVISIFKKFIGVIILLVLLLASILYIIIFTEEMYYWIIPALLVWFMNWVFMGGLNIAISQEKGNIKDVNEIWRIYCKDNLLRNYSKRIMIMLIYFTIFLVLAYYLYDKPYVPFRGLEIKTYYSRVTCIYTICSALLLFFVVDATRICFAFVRKLTKEEPIWPEEKIKKLEAKHNVYFRPALNCWLRIKLIADRTESVNRILNYPFYIIFPIILSWSILFDNWNLPKLYYILLGISIIMPILSGINLRRVASRAKGEALKKLQGKIIEATNEMLDQCLRSNGIRYTRRSIIEQIKLLQGDIMQIRKGAFTPFLKQPFVQAILFFLSGLSVVLGQIFYN